MHKTIKPGYLDAIRECLGQFPHCDQRILHAPGECKYCDSHPEWQALRLAWKIAFTGWTPDADELPCPANKARGTDVDQVWPGNKPKAEPAPNDSTVRIGEPLSWN